MGKNRIRLSDITLDKTGIREEGMIVVAAKSTAGLTKGKQYELRRAGRNPIYYVRDDRNLPCSEMKLLVSLEDWRQFALKSIGI